MRKKTPQERGYDFEKRFGSLLGLKVTRGSGNQWFAKGDLGGQGMKGELKHTDKKSFSVTADMIRKLMSSVSSDEEPFWAVDLDGEVLIIQRADDWIRSRTEEGTGFIKPDRAELKRRRSRIPSMLRDQEEQ